MISQAQKAAQMMAWALAQPDTRTPAQKQWAEDFAREMVARLERQCQALEAWGRELRR